MKKTHAVLMCFFAALVMGAVPLRNAEADTPAAERRIGDKITISPVRGPEPRTVYKTTDWDALIPADWNPTKGIQTLGLSMLSDSDPRAIEALNELREAWETAPAVPTMDKSDIRIAGFVVPLDAGTAEGLREFLLVPYFGACIHTPPPPANQVIHVTLARPAKSLRMMDAIWISGRLHVGRASTNRGAASYKMDGQLVAPYAAPSR